VVCHPALQQQKPFLHSSTYIDITPSFDPLSVSFSAHELRDRKSQQFLPKLNWFKLAQTSNQLPLAKKTRLSDLKNTA